MENNAENINQQETTRNRIVAGFIRVVLETGNQPASVYQFAQQINISEEEFYHYFTSFQGVKAEVWDQIFDQTLDRLHAQEVYPSYSAREKLLSFYFTWVEELKRNRSYLLALYENHAGFRKVQPGELRSFRHRFKAFAKGIIQEGKATDEIANRRFFGQRYEDALWLETLFVFQFWLKDMSVSYENTDAAIEKSVTLAFDLIGRNAVDSFVDLAKFLYHSK